MDQSRPHLMLYSVRTVKTRTGAAIPKTAHQPCTALEQEHDCEMIISHMERSPAETDIPLSRL